MQEILENSSLSYTEIILISPLDSAHNASLPSAPLPTLPNHKLCLYRYFPLQEQRLILWFFPSDITKNIMPQTESAICVEFLLLVFFCIVRWRKKKFISIELKMKEKIESDARAMKMKRQLNKKIKLTHRKESRRRDTDKS